MSTFVFSAGHFWPPCMRGWIFLFRSGSAGNETVTCALTETTQAYLGAVSIRAGGCNQSLLGVKVIPEYHSEG